MLGHDRIGEPFDESHPRSGSPAQEAFHIPGNRCDRPVGRIDLPDSTMTPQSLH